MNLSKEEDSDDAIETGNNSNEPEEGEWTDEVEQVEKESEDETNGDSDFSEKEIQGPKGSVIKVVPRVKPRVASTVWSRLNITIPEANTNDRYFLTHIYPLTKNLHRLLMPNKRKIFQNSFHPNKKKFLSKSLTVGLTKFFRLPKI